MEIFENYFKSENKVVYSEGNIQIVKEGNYLQICGQNCFLTEEGKILNEDEIIYPDFNFVLVKKVGTRIVGILENGNLFDNGTIFFDSFKDFVIDKKKIIAQLESNQIVKIKGYDIYPKNIFVEKLPSLSVNSKSYGGILEDGNIYYNKTVYEGNFVKMQIVGENIIALEENGNLFSTFPVPSLVCKDFEYNPEYNSLLVLKENKELGYFPFLKFYCQLPPPGKYEKIFVGELNSALREDGKLVQWSERRFFNKDDIEILLYNEIRNTLKEEEDLEVEKQRILFSLNDNFDNPLFPLVQKITEEITVKNRGERKKIPIIREFSNNNNEFEINYNLIMNFF